MNRVDPGAGMVISIGKFTIATNCQPATMQEVCGPLAVCMERPFPISRLRSEYLTSQLILTT